MFENAIASVAVKDLQSAARWYERLFGRPPDSSPMAEVKEWKFPRGGWLQVYELAVRAGSCSCTLAVSDLDEQIGRLREMGIEMKRPPSGPTVKVVMIADLDGNSLALAQALVASVAQ
jgi:predicted enzyme related to lactoylglutathione lyase